VGRKNGHTGRQALVGDKTPLKHVAVVTAPADEWAERSHIKRTVAPSSTVVPGAGSNVPYDVTPTTQLDSDTVVAMVVVLNFYNFETIQAKMMKNVIIYSSDIYGYIRLRHKFSRSHPRVPH
jgi:hypothetical protein